MGIREEFEKLPEISTKLHAVTFNEQFNDYHAAMINSSLSVRYVKGAWYAFQEQQKKIELLCDVLSDHMAKHEIQDLLK